MRFQTNQIQSLIAEIDGVLAKGQKSPLSWLNFGNNTQQRQVLERIRRHLEEIQQQMASKSPETSMAGEIEPLQALPLKTGDSVLSDRDRQKTPDRVLQAVVQEMEYLRTFYERATYTHLQQQYQADIQTLQQQRQALIEEIKQLEERRQSSASLPVAGQEKRLEASSIAENSKNSAIDPTLPYAGVELPPETIASPLPQSSQAEELAMSDIAQITPPACKIEDAPALLNENALGEISDTISSLTDLIAQPSLENTDNLDNRLTIATPTTEIPNVSDPTSNILGKVDDIVTEENFLPASPDEDLLATLESATKSNIDLWLGKSMFDQLSQDLSSLEGNGDAQAEESADRMDLASNLKPNSFPERDTQVNAETYVTSETKPELSYDDRPLNFLTQTETIEPLEPVPLKLKEEIPFNIPEDILAEFDDLFGESFDKPETVKFADGESIIKTEEPEKKN